MAAWLVLSIVFFVPRAADAHHHRIGKSAMLLDQLEFLADLVLYERGYRSIGVE
jgi:hypothetical protein